MILSTFMYLIEFTTKKSRASNEARVGEVKYIHFSEVINLDSEVFIFLHSTRGNSMPEEAFLPSTDSEIPLDPALPEANSYVNTDEPQPGPSTIALIFVP